MRSPFGEKSRTPSAKALEVPGIKDASFWQDPRRLGDNTYRGVVYDEVVGQEYDVREVRFGWIVNDDWGGDHFGLTIRHAILKARVANQ